MTVQVQFGDFKGAAVLRKSLSTTVVRTWVKHSLAQNANITVRIVGETEGLAMNMQFRGKAYATNVLTFAYDAAPADGQPLSADLIICAPVVEQEAVNQGKSLMAHYAHLIIHGTLHAQGYDHETHERDALKMETLEILLLAALDIANPY